jgi:hypothetical protein
MYVEADSLGFILDVLSIFNVITAWGNNLSHKFIGNVLSVENCVLCCILSMTVWLYQLEAHVLFI